MSEKGKGLTDKAGSVVGIIILACIGMLAVAGTIRGVMYIFTGR